jgi:proline racemase
LNPIETWSKAATRWRPPPGWESVTSIDAHTAGEPLRIFVDGFPQPGGDTILQRRSDARQRLEFYRTGTMWEPRGHADMYGCLIVPPERPDSDFGVLFLHNEGYSSMCGHGIIAVATVAVEVGWVQTQSPTVPISIDAPAGQIRAEVFVESGRAKHVAFENVPSFAVALDQSIQVQEVGKIQYDLAFGGAYYAFVDAGQCSMELEPQNLSKLIELGRAIKETIASQIRIRHPQHADLFFLYGTIFTGPPHQSAHHSRHVCIFADGEVDRSPTGTGVSARAAILAARESLPVGQCITIESVLGTCFDVEIVKETIVSDVPAVIPRVCGSAFITARNEFLFAPDDLLRSGFLLR